MIEDMTDDWVTAKILSLGAQARIHEEQALAYRKRAEECAWEAELARKTGEWLAKATA